eukprot:1235819-Lingulodinium_polyedra.AAC.1
MVRARRANACNLRAQRRGQTRLVRCCCSCCLGAGFVLLPYCLRAASVLLLRVLERCLGGA